MGMFEDVREWAATALFLLVALFVAIKIIETLCSESSLFCQTIQVTFGTVIFALIVGGILYFIRKIKI